MLYARTHCILALLLHVQECIAQSSTASWLYPSVDKITINVIDTIVWQWTSNYEEAWMLLWCQVNGPGENVSLGSQLQVQPNGSFPYIMFSQNPAQRRFPVACHAQLSTEPNGPGPDSPVGITWTSQTNVAARTFSLAQAQLAPSSVSGGRSSSSVSITSSSSTSSTQGRETGSATMSSSQSSLRSTVTTPAVLPTSSSSSPPTAPPSPNTPSSLTLGLSIGLSITIFVLVIVALFFLRRRRKAGKEADVKAQHRNTGTYGDARFGRHEMEDEPRRLHEMEAREREKAELDATENFARAELEGKRKSGWSIRERWKKGGSIYELP